MELQVFEFKEYEVPIEIGWHRFYLDCSADTGDYLRKSAAELKALAEQMEAGEKTIQDAIDYGCKMLDALLGEGSSDKIFEQRKKRLSDIIDICNWLTEIAVKFRKEKQANG